MQKNYQYNTSKLHFILFWVLFQIMFSKVGSATEDAQTATIFQDCIGCPTMISIPKGEYAMGMPPIFQGRPYDKGEMRRIVIPRPFAMGVYEVTFNQWEQCVRSGGCEEVDDRGMGRGDRPVVNVSWRQAVKYAKWLSALTGEKYRLPTEAEWEYAGRAGSTTSRFFGIRLEMVCEYANIFDIHAWKVLQYEWEHLPCEDGYVESAPVGSFKPNAFGLYDMLGNVWEWTEDCLAYTFRPSNGTSSEAVLRGDCSQRAYRGASWLNHPAKYIGPSDRYKYLEVKESDLGFRLVREIE